MATHSSILAWEIPWTEEPGALLSVITRVRNNLMTKQQEPEAKMKRSILRGAVSFTNTSGGILLLI